MPKYLIDPDGMTDEVRTDKGIFVKGQWVTLSVKEAKKNPNLIPENEVKKRMKKLEGDKNNDKKDDNEGDKGDKKDKE